MPVSLTNSVDIVANSVAVIQNNQIVDVAEKFGNITGLAPEALNSLEKLATALNNDANFFQTTTTALGTKATTEYVDANLEDVYDAMDMKASIDYVVQQVGTSKIFLRLMSL